MCYVLLATVFAAATAAADGSATPYRVEWHNQTLDHFRFGAKAQSTWPQRYLIDDSNWNGSGALANGCKGPILLYTGNVSPVSLKHEPLSPPWHLV